MFATPVVSPHPVHAPIKILLLPLLKKHPALSPNRILSCPIKVSGGLLHDLPVKIFVFLNMTALVVFSVYHAPPDAKIRVPCSLYNIIDALPSSIVSAPCGSIVKLNATLLKILNDIPSELAAGGKLIVPAAVPL